MKKQIEGELAWRRVLGRQVEPFVNISDDEVNQVIARLKASKGAAEFHVAEIYLSATPINQAQVLAKANDLVDKIRHGSSFVAYAHEFSEASTKAVGGDLGWLRAEQLPDPLDAAVHQMPTKAVSPPIDGRAVGTGTPGAALETTPPAAPTALLTADVTLRLGAWL